MPLFTADEARFVTTLGQLIDHNPFLPGRVDLEREALGEAFVNRDANWNLEPATFRRSENVQRIADRADALVRAKQPNCSQSTQWSDHERCLYADLLDYHLFSQLTETFDAIIDAGHWQITGKFYRAFVGTLEDIQPPCLAQLAHREPEHLFALYFQLYRAFRNIFDHLTGSSPPIIKLRADVWQSIFSYDVRRYRKCLFDRMHDFSTLITGPSGTGKELVARAIGLSCYLPFSGDEKQFTVAPKQLFAPVNLSALSPTLIESELFGHKKGAYTGATADRQGWLENCPRYGAVFLDEIGELSPNIQVKLLRVLQERTFQRLGDTHDIPFAGRIISATNRDLARQVREEHFRPDFYYRICSDRIEMPTLQARLQADEQELGHLVHHLLRRFVPAEAASLTQPILEWIERQLGATYAWPGNVRELEQCVRSYVLRQHYEPLQTAPYDATLQTQLTGLRITADELVSQYCDCQYARLGSYQAVGQQLDLDRRTVKAKVDQARGQ